VDHTRNRGFIFSNIFILKIWQFFPKNLAKLVKFTAEKKNPIFVGKRYNLSGKKTLIRNGCILNTLMTTFFTQMSVW
jgi:hypothetical protein